MRFKEASPETSGCNARGFVKFRKTAKMFAKSECPNGKLRCCMFCETECQARCEVSEIVGRQPLGFQERYDCRNLRPSMELAWNWLGR